MKKIFKNLFGFVFVLALCMLAFPGIKSWAKTYHIKTADDLRSVAADLNGKYYLDKDINLGGGKEWKPIGTDEAPFTGKFYGQGHNISGLKITTTEYNAGFFGVTKGATITKLSVDGKIKHVNTYAGGIVGHATDKTVIKYCISNVMVSGSHQIGGVVGRISDSSMEYCMNLNTVTASGRGCGGITADLYPSGTLKKCLNLADVSGGYDITGGITGGSTAGTVSGCINKGNVSCERGRIGAIAGDNASYAGARYWNYFLQTEDINANLKAVGSNCGVITSAKSKKISSLKKKINSKFD